MKKEYRIKKNNEIEDILKNKKYYTSPYFIIYKKYNNETSHFRYAISVGKKIGKAVIRNRIKRQITAIIDNLDIDLNINVDIFIIARVNILNINYQDMEKNINYLLMKLKVIKGDING